MQPSNIQLRDYQQECLTQIHAGHQAGIVRQLVALPTGTGKTVIFSQLPQVFSGQRMLVIAHREELLDQAAEKIEWANPGIKVDVEMASRVASTRADVVVGSIQSLSGHYGHARLDRLNPESFGLLVIDEAHHAPAMTYLSLLARFGLAPVLKDLANKTSSSALHRVLNDRCSRFTPSPEAPLLVGFTATPHRTDGIGLHYIFDDISFSRTIKEMMTAPAPGPWLCDIRGYRFDTGMSLKAVKTSHGDYQSKSLSEAVNNEARNITAVKAYLALGSGRQAICFCVDVAHSKSLMSQFAEHGVATACIVGTDDIDDRRKAVADFRAGRIEVLVNCMVLTEGFDCPDTSCIIMARPTKSQLLYTQMIGRGTRLAPGKRDLIVIDLADTDSVGVASVNSLFGLPPKMETKKKGLIEVQKEFDLIVEEHQLDPGMFDGAQTIEQLQAMATEYNPLNIPQMPDGIEHSMTWSPTPYGYVLTVNHGLSIGIAMDLLDHAQVQVKRRTDGSHASRMQSLGAYATIQDAIEAAEKLVRQECPDEMGLLLKDANWRKKGQSEAASEKQVQYLKWLKVQHPDGITKTQAGDLITRAKADRAFKTKVGAGAL